jgi:hypothetical protein
MDIASFIIAALIHDYKHFGVNNQFLINTNSKLATRYNDRSVLENYHVAESFKICNSGDEYNIFKLLTADEAKIMRKRMIDCVMATDMSLHS